MTKVITGFVFVCWDCPFPWKLFGQVFDRLFGNIQLRSPEIKKKLNATSQEDISFGRD